MAWHEIDGNSYTTEELRSSQNKAFSMQCNAARLEGEVSDAEFKRHIAAAQQSLRAAGGRLESIINSGRNEGVAEPLRSIVNSIAPGVKGAA